MAEKKNQPNRAASVVVDETMPVSNAAPLILQWLTYAFWGWCGIAMIWLSIAVFEYFVMGSYRSWSTAETIAYPVAAVTVLLVIAATIDWFYSRVEPAQKHGAAMVIMVIHAVIFALATIGALITAVFALVNMSLQNGRDGTSAQVFLFAALLCVVVFGALTARTVLAGKTKNLREIMWGVLGLTIIGTLLAAFFGPVTYASYTKQDRLIERGLPGIVNEISTYVSRESQLPATLDDIEASDAAAQQLIDDGELVTYKPNTKPVKVSNGEQLSIDPKAMVESADLHYYQLCVTFKSERKDPLNYTTAGYAGEDEDGYAPYLYSISEHPKGYHCYKLMAPGAYDVRPTPAAIPSDDTAVTAF